MRIELLTILRCPRCIGRLELRDEQHDAREIRTGHLCCIEDNAHRYKIEEGIVRFCTESSNPIVQSEIRYATETFQGIPLMKDPDHVAQYPDTLGKLWPHTAHFGPDFKSAIRALNIKPGDWILDVGTSACWSTRLLAQTGAHVVAIDVVETPFNGLRTSDILFEAHGVYFDRVLESMTRLAFAPGSIDHIVFNASYHHTPDERRTLEECHRVLKPGGRILMLQEFSSLANRLRVKGGPIGSVEHGSSHHEINFSTFKRDARSIGFSVSVAPSELLRRRLSATFGNALGGLCASVLARHEWLLESVTLACVFLTKT